MLRRVTVMRCALCAHNARRASDASWHGFVVDSSTPAVAEGAPPPRPLPTNTKAHKDDAAGVSVADLVDDDQKPLFAIRLTHRDTGMQFVHLSSVAPTSALTSAEIDDGASQQPNGPRPSEEYNATEKSAAEKAFCIGFCTPPLGDTGVTHVLEHTALCGSTKFPVRDPFFKMYRRSLKTFMNAMTGPDTTIYPFSTVNRKDFFNLMDVYLQSVFSPLLRPLDFAQEGHRFELLRNASAASTIASQPTTMAVRETAVDVHGDEERGDDPSPVRTEAPRFQLNGVVYNEMKGVLSDPMSEFQMQHAKHTMAGTPFAFNFGGDPESIPQLTDASLRRYHAQHYHPSNAIVVTVDTDPDPTTARRTLDDILRALNDSAVAAVRERGEAVAATARRLLPDHLATLDLPVRAAPLYIGYGPCDAGAPPPAQPDSETTTDSRAEHDDDRSTSSSPSAVPDAATSGTTARVAITVPVPAIAWHTLSASDKQYQALRLAILTELLLGVPNGELHRAIFSDGCTHDLLGATAWTDGLLAAEYDAFFREHDAAASTFRRPTVRPSSSVDALRVDGAVAAGGGAVDLLPGSGFITSLNEPRFVVGLQQLAVRPFRRGSGSHHDAKASTEFAATVKAAVLHRAVVDALARIEARGGFDASFVDGVVHQYELGLRHRGDHHIVNAAQAAASARVRGMDEVSTQQTLRFIERIKDEIGASRRGLSTNGLHDTSAAPTNGGGNTAAAAAGCCSYFLTDVAALRLALRIDHEPGVEGAALTTIVLGDPRHEENQSRREQQRAQALAAQRAQSEHNGDIVAFAAATKRRSEALDAFQQESAGPAQEQLINLLPTLTVADIAPHAPRLLDVAPCTVDGRVYGFLGPTAGLLYVTVDIPIAATAGTFMTRESGALAAAFPLLCDLLPELGSASMSHLDFKTAWRNVASDLQCGPVLATGMAPTGGDATRPNEVSAFGATTRTSLRLKFSVLPSRLSAALSLLSDLIDGLTTTSGDRSVWRKDDAALREHAAQLIVAAAGREEGGLQHDGMAAAMSAAIGLFATSRGGSEPLGAGRIAEDFIFGASVTQRWGPLPQLHYLSSLRTKLLSDPSAALEGAMSQCHAAAAATIRSSAAHVIVVANAAEHIDGAVRALSAFHRREFCGRHDGQLDAAPLRRDGGVPVGGLGGAASAQEAPTQSKSSRSHRLLVEPMPTNSAFVGVAVTTGVALGHEDYAALRLATQLVSQDYLHKEVRERGGAYGSAASVSHRGLQSGVLVFGSYRDPSPVNTIEVIENVRSFLHSTQWHERHLDEAKLAVFSGVDAPVVASEIGIRQVCSGIPPAFTDAYRRALKDCTKRDIERVAEKYVPMPSDVARRAAVAVIADTNAAGSIQIACVSRGY